MNKNNNERYHEEKDQTQFQNKTQENFNNQHTGQCSNSHIYPNFPNFLQQPSCSTFSQYEHGFPMPFLPFQRPPFHPPSHSFSPSLMYAEVPSFDKVPYSSNFNQFNTVIANNRIENKSSGPNGHTELEYFFKDKVYPPKPNIAFSQIQLWKVSKQFVDFYKMLKKLETDLEFLQSRHNQINESSWNEACNNINLQKEQLLIFKQSINTDPEFLRLLKIKINKRKKKRKLMKKRKMLKAKMPSKYEIAEKHMQKLQQSADKKKQEEKLKAEADQILSTVRQKKSEANYQINLLSAIMKLHTARIQSSNTSQKYLKNISNNGFNKIMEKLKMLWEKHLQEYLIEEKGLNVMLQDLAVTVKDEEVINLKNTFRKWLKFIFGTTDSLKGLYYSNFNQLINIRQTWDKFIVNEETQGSRIPAGWVIPKFHSDDSWTKLISDN